MGTRMDSSYASIYEVHRDPINIYISHKIQDMALFTDDVLMIWGHGRNELESFRYLANNLHPTIKFCFTINKQKIPVLYTVISRGSNNYILTKMYHKPTDNMQYLHFNSAHIWKQKNSIPYGLPIRCRRICSEEKHFEEEAKIIIYKLTTRKYPTKLLQEASDKASKMDRLRHSTKRNQISSD